MKLCKRGSLGGGKNGVYKLNLQTRGKLRLREKSARVYRASDLIIVKIV